MTEPKIHFQERVNLLETAMSNKKGNRVPVVSMATTWTYWHAGYLPKDGLENPEINLKVLRKFYDDFYWDGIIFVRNGKAFSQSTLDILGGGTFTYDKNGMQQTAPGSVTVMEEGEYPELTADPYRFILEKVFPRRYRLMAREDDGKYADMCKVMEMVEAMNRQNALENAIAPKEYGIPQMRIAAFFNPVDIILDYLRDFDVIISDVKRRPQAVRDAGLAMVDLSLDHIGNAKPEPGKALVMPMHLPQFLRAKDFEKVYWPSWKKVADEISRRGFKVIYYFERSYAHLFDYLRELPEGTVGLFEDDKVWDAKAALPNMAVAGGMPNDLLYRGTKQECVDYAKMLVDKTAANGGYLFTTNMIMLTPSDGKAENLKAVNEFVCQYSAK